MSDSPLPRSKLNHRRCFTTCPQCGKEFIPLDRGANGREGYTLLGKGSELSLIRCDGCNAELPVPETDDVSISYVIE